MYKGNLKDNFYVADNVVSKIPVKVYMVFDKAIGSSVYHSSNIFRGLGVDIEANPGLRISMVSAFSSIFESLHEANAIDQITIKNYDYLAVPRIEIIGEAVTMSLIMKDSESDNIISSYKSTGNIYNTVPASAHVLQVINIIPFAGLTTPIIIPISANIIGGAAEKDFEIVLRQTLGVIADDIRNDRSLVSKIKKDK
jgi:hypothetical protein